jgi:DNA-binding transcriptional LysR family regulator
MDRLTSLTVCVRVVDSGGFAAAARRLNMSTTMVSSHVQSLEQRLVLDPPVRHAEPQHRPILRRSGNGTARCRGRLALAGLNQAEQSVSQAEAWAGRPRSPSASTS